MMPLHFGRRERLLFGIYEPAVGRRQGRGVVLCNPWGTESVRAHRSLKQLADRLARKGLDVLRFDYYGTGDSFGDGTSVRLSGWIEDAESAVEELMGVAGVRTVSAVGLRLGAGVAAKVAAARPDVVDRVVLWEPVTAGPEYLDELLDGVGQVGDEPVEVSGFPLPRDFVEDLKNLDLRGTPGRRCRALLARAAPPSAAELERIDASDVAVVAVDSPSCWVEEADYGAGAVPVDMLAAIVEWLA